MSKGETARFRSLKMFVVSKLLACSLHIQNRRIRRNWVLELNSWRHGDVFQFLPLPPLVSAREPEHPRCSYSSSTALNLINLYVHFVVHNVHIIIIIFVGQVRALNHSIHGWYIRRQAPVDNHTDRYTHFLEGIQITVMCLFSSCARLLSLSGRIFNIFLFNQLRLLCILVTEIANQFHCGVRASITRRNNAPMK